MNWVMVVGNVGKYCNHPPGPGRPDVCSSENPTHVRTEGWRKLWKLCGFRAGEGKKKIILDYPAWSSKKPIWCQIIT